MTTTTPTDPAAYRVALSRAPRRNGGGRLMRVSVFAEPAGDLIASYSDDEGELTRLLRLAAEEEDTDPYSDRLPSDRAIIAAALRDAGIAPAA